MSASNFGRCLNHVFRFEGGYVDHPDDPGGATNYGITIGTLSDELGRPASKQEVRELTPATAAIIYRKKYWNVVRGDDLPDGMDLVAFDAGVNSGPVRGIRWLQRGLRVSADGIIGPQTLKAATGAVDGIKVIQRACAARLGFLQGLRHWTTFGRGWSRRVVAVEVEAVSMYTRDARKVSAEADGADKAAKRKNAEAAGAGTGGAASTFSDLPDLAFYGVIAIAVVVAVLLVARAIHHRHRADAYHDKAKEMISRGDVKWIS